MRQAKTLRSATIPNGNVASILPFWLGVALQNPDPPFSSGGVWVAFTLTSGTNCVGLTIVATTLVGSPGAVVGRGVRVGSGVGVAVGTSVGVGEGTTVGAIVGVSVGVLVGAAVGVLVGVGVYVSVGVGVGVGVLVGAGVGVSVGVAVSVGVGVMVGVSVGVGVGVNVGNRSGNTNEKFSNCSPPTNAPGGDNASRKRGAPVGSFRSMR